MPESDASETGFGGTIVSMARLALIFVLLLLGVGASAEPAKPSAPIDHKSVAPPPIVPSPPAPKAVPVAKPAAPTAPSPATPTDDDGKPDTKPGAHFAVLRSDKVNLRTGPGPNYPIDWVFTRKGLPVEVIAVFDTWRKVRDSDGTVGWVQQGMLSDRRNLLVTGAVRVLRREANLEAAVVAQLEPGVIARVSRCDPKWCEVKIQGYRGWLQREEVWGLQPDEVIQ